jgi:SAM-dependent methyltransferase
MPHTDSENQARRDEVREYYGHILTGTKDLKTGACCSPEDVPAEQRDALREIVPEVVERFYGCGSPIPPLLEGCTVLDLGCGAGRDAYIASQLVGPSGRVIGVDMTPEQLEVALRHVDEQTRRFGYARPNVSFRHGFIEDLAAAGVEDASVDVVISNCVINLSPDKERVFSEIFRVLKPGGELYFSDVFAGRRVPAHLANDPVLYGECLGGALYTEDFRRMMRRVGCNDYRVAAKASMAFGDAALERRVGMVDFYSMTVRAFRLDTLEDACEDYGQLATYRGTIPGRPHAFELDLDHRFVAGKPALVCGNTAAMIAGTRYGAHFVVTGDRSTHYGPFDCAPAALKAREGTGAGGACC